MKFMSKHQLQHAQTSFNFTWKIFFFQLQLKYYPNAYLFLTEARLVSWEAYTLPFPWNVLQTVALLHEGAQHSKSNNGKVDMVNMKLAGTYYAAVIENRADFLGRVVVDVGAGSGILSLFAAQVIFLYQLGLCGFIEWYEP